MKKEYFEILLESMTDKINLVLEGHIALNQKMDDYQKKNEEEHRLMYQMIKDVAQMTRGVDKKVDVLDKRVTTLEDKVTILDNKFNEFATENKAAHVAFDKKLDTREKETSDLKRRVSRLEAVA